MHMLISNKSVQMDNKPAGMPFRVQKLPLVRTKSKQQTLLALQDYTKS